jgi:hypothetical protein
MVYVAVVRFQSVASYFRFKFPINAASPRCVWRIYPLSYRFLEDPSSLFRGIRLNSGQALRRGSIALQIRDLQLNDSTLNEHDDRFGPVCHTEFSWNTFQQNLLAGQPKNCKKNSIFS